MPKKAASTTDTVVFNGIRFHRYPNSKKRSERCYYRPSGNLIRDGVGYLHQEIWKARHGPIPEGCHIHHIDGNTLNNDIDNLECKSAGEHTSEHIQKYIASLGPEGRKNHMDAIRPLASLWHKSAAGRKWHKVHAKRTFGRSGRKPVERNCFYCGKVYQTLDFRKGRTFCSGNCRAAWRRHTGVDDEERVCLICGRSFLCNKYQKQRTCSRVCGAELRRRNRR